MNTQMLKILARREPLSKTDWLDILENLRERVKPFLSQFTLEKLWDEKFLEPSPGSDRYRAVNEIGNPRVRIAHRAMEILDTQGLFRCYSAESKGKGKVEYRLWGLTRGADWILLEVTVSYGKGNMPWTIDASLIEGATLTALLEAINIKGYGMWRQFKIAIDEWERRAKAKSTTIERLAQEIRDESELILHLVTLPSIETKKEEPTAPVLA